MKFDHITKCIIYIICCHKNKRNIGWNIFSPGTNKIREETIVSLNLYIEFILTNKTLFISFILGILLNYTVPIVLKTDLFSSK